MLTYVTAQGTILYYLTSAHLLIVFRVRRILYFLQGVQEFFTSYPTLCRRWCGSRQQWVIWKIQIVCVCAAPTLSLSRRAAGPLERIACACAHMSWRALMLIFSRSRAVLWQRRINPSRTPIYRNTSTQLTHICVIVCNLWLSKDEPRLWGMHRNIICIIIRWRATQNKLMSLSNGTVWMQIRATWWLGDN